MRLGDLDALIGYFGDLAGDTIHITDVQAVLDNAPTVSCGECEHVNDRAMANGAGAATAWTPLAHCDEVDMRDYWWSPDFGCSNFKAKP